ncbi:MAG: acyl-CoA synthetase, partial [Alphaproteobacteria bacterium]
MSAAPSRDAMCRIACALIAVEVRRVHGVELPMPHSWPETLPIGDEGLGLDSLERLAALGTLAEAFDLDDASLGSEPPRLVGDWVDWVMDHHASGDGDLTVSTSGSTGSPKTCQHAMADLMLEAEVLGRKVPGRRRVVALVPAHHLYGIIWTALLPDMLGLPIVVGSIGVSLDLAPGDLVVAVPDQWRTIRSLTRRFPEDVVGVSSAGPLDDQLAADLLSVGLTRLLDIYGSSETGGIAVRELPGSAYELLPRWHLVPWGENDWRLGDDHGVLHDLPDTVERIGDRQLRPVGRRDGAVQVGGHNVWPSRVVALLRQFDGIADAAVRL